MPGETDLADTAVIGYQQAPDGVPAPPPAGGAWADRRLEAFGVKQGQTLKVGPQGVPITVKGWVEDTNYLLQGALWVDSETWRTGRRTRAGPTPSSRPASSRSSSSTPPATRTRSPDASTPRPAAPPRP